MDSRKDFNDLNFDASDDFLTLEKCFQGFIFPFVVGLFDGPHMDILQESTWHETLYGMSNIEMFILSLLAERFNVWFRNYEDVALGMMWKLKQPFLLRTE